MDLNENLNELVLSKEILFSLECKFKENSLVS